MGTRKKRERQQEKRRLYRAETHRAVFRWVVKILSGEGVMQGQTVSVDATTLEAGAAMKNIVRRDNGQSYDEYLRPGRPAAVLLPAALRWTDPSHVRPCAPDEFARPSSS